MKKNRLYHSLWAIVLMLAVTISCSEPDPAQIAGDKVKQENLTEIERVEIQQGTRLFKQDVVVTDASGKNKVTFRFASLDKRLLADYIKATTYSIAPVRERGVPSEMKRAEPNVAVGSPDEEIGEIDYNSRVLVEVVDRTFEPGVIGFSMNVKTQPINTSNGRTQARVWAQMISPNWPEELHVYNYNTVGDYVHYKLKKKNYTIDCCWGGYYLIVSQYAEHLGWDIDGPYKVLIDIEWNNSTSTFNVVWVAV